VQALLRIPRGRDFQQNGAATAKVQEPKHLWTWKETTIDPDEHKVQHGMECNVSAMNGGKQAW